MLNIERHTISEEPVVIDKHAMEQEKQDVTFKLSDFLQPNLPPNLQSCEQRQQPRRGNSMKNTMIKLAISLGLTVLVAQQVSAQQNRNCAPREAVVDRLATTYGESRQSIGLGEQGVMIETFASANTGTWTITVTTPNGQTCLVASGQSWEQLAEALPPQGKGA